MERNIKSLFVEAARPRLPQNIADEKIDDFALSVLTKTTIKKLIGEINVSDGLKVDAKRFVKAADIITFGEVERAINEFPHLHKNQVLRLFDHNMVRKNVKLDSTGITRPQLIDLVELLEEYTGLRLTDDSDAPLAYLDRRCNTLTIEDIGDFFSGRDAKISQILKLMNEAQAAMPALPPEATAAMRQAVKKYLATCCHVEENELIETQPITTLSSEFDEQDYYVVVFWAESQFNKAVPNEFVETKTIGDLIDFLAR